MRHRKSGRKLNRNSSHRKAMFKNMAASLFEHEVIRTTLPKAKELRRVAEPLITLAKNDTVANRRLAFARLRDKEMVHKLFTEIAPRFAKRPGGYLRIIKNGFRKDDNALMAVVALVEAEKAEQEPSKKAPAKKVVAAKKAKITEKKAEAPAKKTAKTEAKKEAAE